MVRTLSIAILVSLASGEAYLDDGGRKYRSGKIGMGKHIQCQFLVMGRIFNFSSKALPLPPSPPPPPPPPTYTPTPPPPPSSTLNIPPPPSSPIHSTLLVITRALRFSPRFGLDLGF